jgi:hypothetical protein
VAANVGAAVRTADSRRMRVMNMAGQSCFALMVVPGK